MEVYVLVYWGYDEDGLFDVNVEGVYRDPDDAVTAREKLMRENPDLIYSWFFTRELT